MKYNLLKHQQAGAFLLKEHPYHGLFWEMGTGKTRTILADIYNNQNFPAFVFTKNMIKDAWLNEVIEMGEDPKDICVLIGSSENKIKQIKKRQHKIYINNYESARYIEKYIIAMKPQYIALDESTSIKTPEAKMTKSIHRIADSLRGSCKFRIMTGTPVTRSPLDLWAQMYFLDPNILGYDKFWGFKLRYSILETGYIKVNGQTRTFKSVVGYKNLPELMEKIKPYVSIMKKEWCLDLPERTYKTYTVDLTEKQKPLYKSMFEDLIAYLEGNTEEPWVASNGAAKLIRLQQLIGGYIKLDSNERHYVDENKSKALLDIVEEAGEGQVIVWCRFVPEIKGLHEILMKNNYSADYLIGDVSDADRTIIKQNFKENKTQVLIMQTGLGAYGLTLNNAKIMVYYSNSFNFEHREQSEDRNYRIGQDMPVTIIDIVAKDTVDDLLILPSIKAKRDLASIFKTNRDFLKIVKGEKE